MKVGIKVFPDSIPYLKKVIDYVDFVEIMAVVGANFSGLKDYDIPYIVHNQHYHWGINLANPKKEKLNITSLNTSIKLADDLDAKYIIVHPGVEESKGCSVNQIVKVFRKLNDPRIIVENVPFVISKKGSIFKHFGKTVEGIRHIKKEAKVGFCLDFSHAKCEAIFLGEDYLRYIKKMNNLNPEHYHICDGMKDGDKDLHKHFWEGSMDLETLKNLIPKNKGVTIETNHDFEKQIKEIKFLKL